MIGKISTGEASDGADAVAIPHAGVEYNVDLPKDRSFRWHDVRAISLGLVLLCSFAFFYNLGGPALFEPTEGRNAEIAREILVTHDWVTPHDDFVPVLDKPIFLHWLIALCYKLFGVSEWSARLPSALAGLGSVILIYLFARKFWGLWEASWSTLILASSAQFYVLSHIVIFDMALCFCVTLSLCAFYWGVNSESRFKKKAFYLLMYAAMGLATLIKGPIGVFLPGMVIVFYLFMTKKWFLLREMNFFHGLNLFLIIVVPWYLWVEIRNPGYLYYFLSEENVIRFLAPHFHRSEPLYYFLAVLVFGFMPWTFLLPYVVGTQWKNSKDDTTLFLILWTVLPLLFFSFSQTKLSQYILPIYPPLAILTGTALASGLKHPLKNKKWPLWFPGLKLFLVFSIISVGVYWPELLPHPLQEPVRAAFREVPGFLLLALLLGTTWLALSTSRYLSMSQSALYLLCCGGFALYFVSVQPVVKRISLEISSTMLAEKLTSLIQRGDQLVTYDMFRSSLPFYLKIERPIWVVSAKKDHSIMESYYVAEKLPQPAAVYGRALFPLEGFSEVWGTSDRKLLVLLREKNLRRLVGKNQKLPEIILRADDLVLVANR
jgi:4-amino-4-deoxy-L-arabinose transferase-like glycosyltransferase